MKQKFVCILGVVYLTVFIMNLIGVSTIDDLIYKHLHKSYMNNVCIQIKSIKPQKDTLELYYNEKLPEFLDEFDLHSVPAEELLIMVKWFIDTYWKNANMIDQFVIYDYNSDEAEDYIDDLVQESEHNLYRSMIERVNNTGFYFFV